MKQHVVVVELEVMPTGGSGNSTIENEAALKAVDVALKSSPLIVALKGGTYKATVKAVYDGADLVAPR